MPKPALSSRERVLRTLQHQEPDRVPFDLALTVDIYHRLRQHLGLPPEPGKASGLWTEVSPSLDLLDAMQVDTAFTGMRTPSSRKPYLASDGLVYDEWGIGRQKVERADGSFYYEMVKPPLAGASLEQIANFPWPDPADPERIAGLRQQILEIRRSTDKAVMVKFSSSIWEQSWWMYGLQDWLVDLIEKPDITAAILDRVCDIACGLMERGMDEAGDLVDIVRLSGEDLGTQLAPMISPPMYNRWVKPRFERLWSLARRKIQEKNPAARLMLHSCGNVRPFIPSWIHMGLDILNPIQPQARGMEPDGLKRDFGRELVFHGGIDLQQVLPFGTPDEIRQEVRRYIRALAPGGGYIVAPAHNVQSDVPAENLVALRDAVLEYGTYPIQ
jgi:uroporphyrinogen decarboxylase